jgi:hypothetical protein
LVSGGSHTLVERLPPEPEPEPVVGVEPDDPFPVVPVLPDDPLPVFSVVELESAGAPESDGAPESSDGAPESSDGAPESSDGAPESSLIEVVVALAGVLLAAGVDCSAASTGEIATRPTTLAASGNRNRRVIGRLLALVHLLLTDDQDNHT